MVLGRRRVSLPELIGHAKLGCGRRGVKVDGFIHTEMALPVTGHQRPENGGEDAARRLHHDVDVGAEEEEDDGEQHEKRRDPQAQRPAHRVLYVNHERQRDHQGDREGEVVPVEEGGDVLPPLLRRRVELVRRERYVARPDAAGADH